MNSIYSKAFRKKIAFENRVLHSRVMSSDKCLLSSKKKEQFLW